MLEKFKASFQRKAIKEELESREKESELIKEIPLQEGKRFTVEKENGEVRVLLKEDEKVLGNFNKLLPEGYQYEIGDEWLVDWEREKVVIGDWKDSRNILSLLHEIGHARDPEEYIKRLGYKLKHLELVEESVESRERIMEEYQKKGIAERTEKGQYYGEIEKQTKDFLKNVSNLVIREKGDIIQAERNAWAWALKAARNISRNKEVNLLQGFRNVKEIKDWIDRSLETYRKYCLVEFKDLFPRGVYTEKEIKRFLKEKKQYN